MILPDLALTEQQGGGGSPTLLEPEPLLAESSQISFINSVIVNQICFEGIFGFFPFVGEGAIVQEIDAAVAVTVG